MFLTSLGLAVLHLLGVGHGNPSALVAMADNRTTFLSIVLRPWATAMHAVAKPLKLEWLAARSKNIAQVLEGHSFSVKARTTDEFRPVVREASHVVDLQNHEWSVLLHFVPPEPMG